MLPVRSALPLWAALGTVLFPAAEVQAAATSPILLHAKTNSTSNTTATHSVPVASSSALPRNGSEIYQAKFPAHNPKTPKYINVTHTNINPLWKAAHGLGGKHEPSGKVAARDALPEGACAPGTPCVNGACCSNEGWCGFSPDFCGADVCISNCDAKAECGTYALPGNEKCPLNVCCSTFGFCGTSDEFCGKTCDRTYGNCGTPASPSCPASQQTAQRRKIGYYEGWATTRPCDQRAPEDLVLSGFTHLNFAFAFFHPITFQMTAMDSTSATLYSRFTALKKNAPGLQTWISVGGWSFNDETNVPNTRTAFSDMVSTAENRATFIASLTHFMSAYGFDGVDIDWEYPGADDRGGRKEDGANFVALLKDMRAAWGNTYGISCTLPSSYWYLQHFDLPGMEQYLDWFNMMSYDIHGVWDSASVWAGPYVRPHTNLTEIDAGLSLLWRVNVDPSKVVLGLGWYGRSFTLSDPSCNKPWCIFTSGGQAGPCSGESGILSNAEIYSIVQQKGLKPTIDQDAAVAYVSWDDQWVSYDTAETMSTKMTYANEHCLGGTMVWAIDLDDQKGTSLGISDPNYQMLLSCMFVPCTQPSPFGDAPDIPSIMQRSAGNDACYTSFCGQGCEPGYAEVSQMTGKVGTLPVHSECPAGTWQSLCCATGTQYGTCQWRGYGGLGFDCRGGCLYGETAIAQNTNHLEFSPITDSTLALTCFLGYQTFCCSEFVPPPEMPQLNLLGEDGAWTDFENTDGWSAWRIEQEAALCPDLSVLVNAEGAASVFDKGIPVDIGLIKRSYPVTDTPSALTSTYLLCFTANSVYKTVVSGAIAGYSANKAISYGIGVPLKPPTKNPIKNTVGNSAPKIGPWVKQGYQVGIKDCSTTYYCRYGNGFDTICDNHRYAIEQFLNGNRVYHFPQGSSTGARPQVKKWKSWHHKNWKLSWQDRTLYPWLPPSSSACDVDEFPLNAFLEAANPQVLRAVDHRENNAQGVDFSQWKAAVWQPCAALRALFFKGPPPVTMTWTGIPQGDDRLLPTGVIRRYGFQSNSWEMCLATATPSGAATVISDHGFRVASTDPLFSPTGLGLVTWPYRGKTFSVDPLNIPTRLRGAATSIFWPADFGPIVPWLKARDGTDEELVALGVDLANSTEAAGIKERRAGRRAYLDNEKRELCHKLFRRDGKALVEAMVSEEYAALEDRCLAAFPTDVVTAETATHTTSPRTTAKLSPPETTMVQDTAGFIIITTKLADPTPSSN